MRSSKAKYSFFFLLQQLQWEVWLYSLLSCCCSLRSIQVSLGLVCKCVFKMVLWLLRNDVDMLIVPPAPFSLRWSSIYCAGEKLCNAQHQWILPDTCGGPRNLAGWAKQPARIRTRLHVRSFTASSSYSEWPAPCYTFRFFLVGMGPFQLQHSGLHYCDLLYLQHTTFRYLILMRPLCSVESAVFH